MATERWFIGHHRPHVAGAIAWYGAYRTEAEAEADVPKVESYWLKRRGPMGPIGYTFVERDDDSDVSFGAMLPIEIH